MWRKRKASSVPARYTDEPRRKRLRNNLIISSSEDEEENETEESENEDSGNDEEWDIKCILDETDSQYLIDWEGPWSPTWEPKDNANDVAVKVWEDIKKQRSSRTRAPSSPPLQAHSPSSSSSTSDTPSQSSVIEIENTEPVECEVQQPIQQDIPYPRSQRQASPLFVPFDAASSDEEDIPLVRSPKTRALLLSSSQRAPSSSRVVPSSTQQSRSIPVFEYVRKSPIPQEFILPGESKETPLNISQTTSISEGALFVPGGDNEPRSDSLCVPETDQQPQRIKEVGNLR
ncbi:uncharacterized protein ASPGLDRAFT_465039 [Aspergillus glaucus CBS 516.65]|uniref:Chromo domain-containing protein n=1 Tax=Aspergillus glaucus CBS 516.65 TaxID=1160497 RepID=A0A1L9VGX1_ASPGL|nr:hypothetical protein ASPGLDRAFT_465039 [Aspergillus glaucus CBS 516.65]OJJ83166.1 hypothetical protein ASPGLDRAFT_465039 [Aspergillus glaucus CBS 516.65]